MYIFQKELLWGLDKAFVKELVDMTVKETYEAGHLLFHEGDPANHFYTLIKGAVRLTVGKEGHLIYLVNHSGESFGWSSIVGRDAFSASAECLEPSIITRVDREDLLNLMEREPASGLFFFKRVSELLGNRLIQAYGRISSAVSPEDFVSHGTGQIHYLDKTG